MSENAIVIPEVTYGADVTWGKYGKEILSSIFWEVYFNDRMMGPDEVIVQHSKIEVEVPEAPQDSEGEELIPNSIPEGCFKVTITPDENLKVSYPEALVVVDSKWYDLNHLSEPLLLNIVENHRISIVWSPDTLVETFLLKKKFC